MADNPDLPDESDPSSSTNLSAGRDINIHELVGRDKITYIGPDAPPDDPTAPSPYKGLEFFDEADAKLFYGREKLVAKLVSHICRHPVLAVTGASGSGKSSLVRAGLIQALKTGALQLEGTRPPPDSPHWHYAVITPTDFPLKVLAQAVGGDPAEARRLELDLAHNSTALAQALNGQSDSQRWLIFVDQFEELFTQCKEASVRQAFVDNLMTAAEMHKLLCVVLTLRADFYDKCFQINRLRDLLEHYQVTVGAMDRDELRLAITEPARSAGWFFQDGLDETILKDTEHQQLPLLSHAMRETWKRRSGRYLTFAGYDRSGRVGRAIVLTAEAVYEGLIPKQQQLAKTIFLRLVELVDGQRPALRRTTIDQLIPSSEMEADVRAILDRLVQARLIVTDRKEHTGSVEVVHEALVREWTRLHDWLDKDRDGQRIRQALAKDASEWANQKPNPDEGLLYRGGRLAQALEWADEQPSEALNALEREFLKSSREREELERDRRIEEERQRRIAAEKLATADKETAEQQTQKLVVQEELVKSQTARVEIEQRSNRRLRVAFRTLAGLATLLLIALVLAFQQYLTASAQRLAVQASTSMDRDPFLASTLALDSLTIFDTQEAQQMLGKLPYALPLELSHFSQIPPDPSDSTGAMAADENFSLSNSGDRVFVWGRALLGGGTLFEVEGNKSIKVFGFPSPSQLTLGPWDIFQSYSFDGKLLALCGTAAHPRLSGIPGVPATTVTKSLIQVWDVAANQEAQRLELEAGGLNDVTNACLAVSPSDTYVAARIFARNSVYPDLTIWDLVSGNAQTLVHGDWIDKATWSPDGKLLAVWVKISASGEGIRVIDVASESIVATWNTSSDVMSMAWSPNSQRLAVGLKGEGLSLRDVKTQAVVELPGHTTSVTSLAWSPNGNQLVSGSEEPEALVLVWDVSERRRLKALTGQSHTVVGVAWSPDGKNIISLSNRGQVITWGISGTPATTRLTSHSGAVIGIQWSQDGQTVVTAAGDNRVKVWDVTTGLERLTLGNIDKLVDMDWNADGSLIAVGAFDSPYLTVWDPITGGMTWSADNQLQGVNDVAWRPQSHILAVLTESGEVDLWDTITGYQVNHSPRFNTVEQPKKNPSPSPRPNSGQANKVTDIAWAPDGSLLAVTVSDGISLWDPASSSGQEVKKLTDDAISQPTNVTWSHDGLRIAAGFNDGTIRVWDVSSGHLLKLLSGHSAAVRAIEWNPSDALLASGADDETLRIWDDSKGQTVAVLYGHTAAVTALAWSFDGRYLASGDAGGLIRLVNTQYIGSYCQLLPRSLTKEEQEKYEPWYLPWLWKFSSAKCSEAGKQN